MKQGEPLRIDDFAPLSALVEGYELRPDRAYLILLDRKGFSPGAAHSLMRDVLQLHPHLQIAMIVSPESRAIEVREKELPQQRDGMPASDQEQESKQSREE